MFNTNTHFLCTLMVGFLIIQIRIIALYLIKWEDLYKDFNPLKQAVTKRGKKTIGLVNGLID